MFDALAVRVLMAADQGIWFKLWTSALSDPDLANLSLEDFARWALLGAYVKLHGTGGRLTIAPPGRALCAVLRVPDMTALQALFHRLPNVHEENGHATVSDETILTVSFRNWLKYQGDYSTPRVVKFRHLKRSRGEEKRRDEIRREEHPSVSPPTRLRNDARAVLAFLNQTTARHYRDTDATLRLIECRLRDGASLQDCKTIIVRKWRDWGTDPKMTSYVRPATLFNATKFEQYRGELHD